MALVPSAVTKPSSSQLWLEPLWDAIEAAAAALLALLRQQQQPHLNALFEALRAVLTAQLPVAGAAPRLYALRSMLASAGSRLPHQR